MVGLGIIKDYWELRSSEAEYKTMKLLTQAYKKLAKKQKEIINIQFKND